MNKISGNAKIPLVILAIFVFTPASWVFAQTDPSLIIKQLQEQIKVLQAQVEELKTQITQVKSELNLTRSLSQGLSGDDVKQLQTFLSQKYPEFYSAPITGYFGPLTEQAVRKLQEKEGIEAIGIVGPRTTAKLNELITQGAGKSGTIPPGLLTGGGVTAPVVAPAQQTTTSAQSTTASSATSVTTTSTTATSTTNTNTTTATTNTSSQTSSTASTPSPSFTLSVSPSTITASAGQWATLTISNGTDTTSDCYKVWSNGSYGYINRNSSERVSPTETTTYTVNCYTPPGLYGGVSSSQSVTLTVIPPATPPANSTATTSLLMPGNQQLASILEAIQKVLYQMQQFLK
ncbi:MAG: peptidoglycan-binding protein [Candidatus Zambryskibacteria bacterium]|nr:peptidoglycan-binding protein [Candidatus Zambryskibacteria bacterium]